MKHYAVEYLTIAGRLNKITVTAKNADDAMDEAVRITGIDFAAIQTTEERDDAPAMGGTVYTFHRAEDHAILATAAPGNLQHVAGLVAFTLSNAEQPAKTRRAYIHNGLGVVGAGLCRQGLWHDALRDDYRRFDAAARAERAAAGYPND